MRVKLLDYQLPFMFYITISNPKKAFITIILSTFVDEVNGQNEVDRYIP